MSFPQSNERVQAVYSGGECLIVRREEIPAGLFRVARDMFITAVQPIKTEKIPKKELRGPRIQRAKGARGK